MKTILPDGRIFETQPFLHIEYRSDEHVYKYKFITSERSVTSSAKHLWGVWNKKTHKICMTKMSDIDSNEHELLIQKWS